jgi:hypothetical protein
MSDGRCRSGGVARVGHQITEVSVRPQGEASFSISSVQLDAGSAVGSPDQVGVGGVVKSRATRVYDRYAYDREKQIAVETWGRTLKGILEQKPPATGNVIAITARS